MPCKRDRTSRYRAVVRLTEKAIVLRRRRRCCTVLHARGTLTAVDVREPGIHAAPSIFQSCRSSRVCCCLGFVSRRSNRIRLHLVHGNRCCEHLSLRLHPHCARLWRPTNPPCAHCLRRATPLSKLPLKRRNSSSSVELCLAMDDLDVQVRECVISGNKHGRFRGV